MKLIRRIQYLFHRHRADADLAEEMEFHHSMLAADLGDSGTAARAWGNGTLAAENAREVWLSSWFESLWKDLVYGLRAMRREPGFTFTAAGALAVALGLNICLFTFFNAVALRPWPVPDPSRVVNVVRLMTRGPESGRYNGFGVAEWRYLAARSKAFAGLFLINRGNHVQLAGREATLNYVTGNFFSVLRIDMARGRGFLAEEDSVTAPQPVAVLGYAAWRSRFAADPAIVGKTVRIDDIPFTIVGVAPESFTGTDGNRNDLWAPLSSQLILRPHDSGVLPYLTRVEHCCTPMAGRLARGYTRPQAAAEIDLLMGQLHNRSELARGFTDVTTGTALLEGAKGRQQIDLILIAMFTAMTLVLLLACANVGNLLLARAAARRSEIAVRLSLGGSRLRLIRQLLVESLALASLSAGAGLAMAWKLPSLVVSKMIPQSGFSITPDWRVCLYAASMAVIACVAFGLAPAIHGTGGQIAAVLKRDAGPGGRLRLRSFLLAAQVAISVVLLSASGLMIRGLQRASAQDPGFRIDGISVASLELPASAYAGERSRTFTAQLQDALAEADGLPSVALVTDAPLGNSRSWTAMRLPGQPSSHDQLIQVHQVTAAFFDILSMPIVAGRNLRPADADRDVVILNQTAARQLFGEANPVGQSMVANNKQWEVIGIVRDSYSTDLTRIPPTLYWRMNGSMGVPQLLIGETSAKSRERISAIVASIETRARVTYKPLGDNLQAQLVPARYAAILSGVLGVLALSLATIGMSGVFAYIVRQRTQEIGIRMALGAEPAQVVRLVLGSNLRSLAWGLAAGLAGALAATRLVRSLTAGVTAFDPVAYAAVFVLLAIGAIAASAAPARRAARVDPIRALRWE